MTYRLASRRLGAIVATIAILASVGCDSSPRRPVVLPAQGTPAPAQAGGGLPQSPAPSGASDEQESQQPGSTSVTPTPTPEPTLAPSMPGSPGEGLSAPTTRPDWPVPGADTWDGKSFRGNDLWDVRPVSP